MSHFMVNMFKNNVIHNVLITKWKIEHIQDWQLKGWLNILMHWDSITPDFFACREALRVAATFAAKSTRRWIQCCRLLLLFPLIYRRLVYPTFPGGICSGYGFVICAHPRLETPDMVAMETYTTCTHCLLYTGIIMSIVIVHARFMYIIRESGKIICRYVTRSGKVVRHLFKLLDPHKMTFTMVYHTAL